MQEVETASHVGTGGKNIPGEGKTVAKALRRAFPAVVREIKKARVAGEVVVETSSSRQGQGGR